MDTNMVLKMLPEAPSLVPAPSQVLKVGDISYDLGDHCVKVGEERIPLTPSECKVLRCLMLRPDVPVRKRTLLENIYGLNTGDRDTIQVFICHLRQKLEAKLGRDPIEMSRNEGYTLDSELAKVLESVPA